MIRTLYLKARTTDIDLESMGKADRKRIYTEIFIPVLELFPEEDIDRYGSKIPFLILILISSINEKLLFSDQKPASLLARIIHEPVEKRVYSLPLLINRE